MKINRKKFSHEIAYAVLSYGILLLALWAVSSCSTSKVAVEHNLDHLTTTTTEVHSADTLLHDTQRHDSISHERTIADSLVAVTDVIDSTVIQTSTQTVITRTVNENGDVLGIDRVTTTDTTRDHWRTERSNTTRTSDLNEYDYQLQQWAETLLQMHRDDSLMHIIDSIRQATIVHEEPAPKLTWWDRLLLRLQGLMGVVIIAVVLACLLLNIKNIKCKTDYGKKEEG